MDSPGAKAHKNTRDTTKPHRCVSRWLELGYAAKAHKNTRDTTKPHRCVSRWLELGYAVCRPNNRHMPHAEKRRKQLTGSQEDIEKGPPAKNKTHGGQKDQLEARFIFFCPCPFKSTTIRSSRSITKLFQYFQTVNELKALTGN